MRNKKDKAKFAKTKNVITSHKLRYNLFLIFFSKRRITITTKNKRIVTHGTIQNRYPPLIEK
jgi:hypothetical protein